MRIPRYISGLELIKLLEPFGYSVSRQAGSHIRLTTQHNGPHHITVPNYDPLKNLAYIAVPILIKQWKKCSNCFLNKMNSFHLGMTAPKPL